MMKIFRLFVTTGLPAFFLIGSSCSRPGDNNPQPSTATVITSTVSIISGSSATLGGSVTNDGGSSITDRGVCYATTANPTIANNKAQMGTGTGNFSNTITGLQPNTRYYVRAYASNATGLSYGNEQSFTTSTVPIDSAVALYIGGKDSLFAFNAGTGVLKWKKFIGNDFIISSAAYSNGRVFLAYKNKLFAFDTLGNTLWTGTTNAVNKNSYESPVVGNGLVYTTNYNSRVIYAFNAVTGNIAWTYDATEPFWTSFGTANLQLAGNTLYIASGGYTYAINSITGALRWKTLAGTFPVLPVVANGKVYVMGDHYLFTLDSVTGNILRIQQDIVRFANPLSLNMSNGRFYYVDQYITMAFDTSVNATLAWQNNSVYPGLVLEEEITNAPMIIGNRAYCRKAGGPVMLDTQTGNILWSGSSEGTGVTIVNGIFYTTKRIVNNSAIDHYFVQAIEIETNTQKWLSNNLTLSSFLSSSPCVVTKSGKMHRFGMTYE